MTGQEEAMRTWQTQEAKAKFSELLDTVESSGPQLISRRGTDAAVIVSVQEWKKLKKDGKPSLLDVLLSGPFYEIPVPPRKKGRLRKPIKF